ncbi:MAG: FkbM family methyltransferase [Limnobacter sp.]|uniref:FkbM family methyltransferase n=1 Tax=Limnobacter sp. TaxID=2003368 RepID=UPI0032F078DB
MIKKYLPRFIKNIIKRTYAFLTWDPWVNRSWSQEGEDQVLRRIFEKQANGFYVDVGAHHPKRFSNTYLFYRKGWCGINIDAMPGSMKAFNNMRPRDTNIEVGVAETEGTLDYHVFNEPALNGFSTELSTQRDAAYSAYHVQEVIKVKVLPLHQLFAQHVKDRSIDFMSVDVEGLDLQVLKSNDWDKYRPEYVLAEVLGSSIANLHQHPIAQLMVQNGYEIYAKQVNTVFFKNTRI